MKLHDNGFIGFEKTNSVLEWSGGDTEEAFLHNSKTLPDHWYYHNAPITYKINKNGHRSKDISDLNLDNYLLFTGCSITEGVGLEESKTYCAVLSKKLECDYYNMGLGATGVDVAIHNLLVWFSTVPKKPKAVIIQWPDFTRCITGTSANHLETRGLWQENDDYNRFVDLGINLGFFEAKNLLISSLIKHVIKVPIVEIGVSRLIPIHNDIVKLKIIDFARDLSHPGIKSNEDFAEDIYDDLINNQCLNFYQNTELKS